MQGFVCTSGSRQPLLDPEHHVSRGTSPASGSEQLAVHSWISAPAAPHMTAQDPFAPVDTPVDASADAWIVGRYSPSPHLGQPKPALRSRDESPLRADATMNSSAKCSAIASANRLFFLPGVAAVLGEAQPVTWPQFHVKQASNWWGNGCHSPSFPGFRHLGSDRSEGMVTSMDSGAGRSGRTWAHAEAEPFRTSTDG